MSALFDLLPWLGQLLVLALLLVMLLNRLVTQPLTRYVLLTVLLVLCFTVPLAGSTAAQWLRSVIGDLSVLTLLVLANSLMLRIRHHALLGRDTRRILLVAAAVTGVVFYPLALGMGPIDPYRWGYAPQAMVAVLCALSLVAWLKRWRTLAVIPLLPLLAYNLHLLESDNLWNYLLDPVLVVYALVQVFRALRHRAHA